MRAAWDPFGATVNSHFNGLAAFYFIGVFALVLVIVAYGYFFFQQGPIARLVASWAGVVPFVETAGCCFFGGVGGILCLFSLSLTTFGVESADYLIGKWYANVTGGGPELLLPDLDFGAVTGGLLGAAPMRARTLSDANALKMVDTVMQADAGDVAGVAKALGIDPATFLPFAAFGRELKEAYAAVKTAAGTAAIPQSLTTALAQAGDKLSAWNTAVETTKTILEIFGEADVNETVAAKYATLACNSPAEAAHLPRMFELYGMIVARLDSLASLPGRPASLGTKLDDVKAALLERYGDLVGATGDFLEKIIPVAEGLDVKPLVRILHWFQNVFLWGLPFWGGCISIAAFFGTLGLVVLVLELWLRRVGMMLRKELTVKTTYSYSDEPGLAA
jgi:hypothetical protein